MVGWFNPLQLARTGLLVAVSELLGIRADRRVTEALTGDSLFFSHSNLWMDYSTQEELWIDFASDVGDGFTSAYAVASALAQPTLAVEEPGGHTICTQRGAALVLGGDQVYPVANRDAYRRRFVFPYKKASEADPKFESHLFAIPGNHDWYDGLISFSRLFCRARDIGKWQTLQKRSYFALKLPHRWWLLAVDTHISDDIDRHQLEYFEKVAEKMEPEDRVVLCSAEPHWVLEAFQKGVSDPDRIDNLSFLESRLRRRRNIQIYTRLAGSFHHYRRHAKGQTHNFTAGGGGAFLHPTNGPSAEKVKSGPPPAQDLHLKKEYPPSCISQHLAYGNLLFPFYNPWLGTLTAVLYAALAYPLTRLSPTLWAQSACQAAWEAFAALVFLPDGIGGILLLILACVGFSQFDSFHKGWGKLAGGIHCSLQLGLILLAFWQIQHLLAGKGWNIAPTLSLILALSLSRLLSYLLRHQKGSDHPLIQLALLALPLALLLGITLKYGFRLPILTFLKPSDASSSLWTQALVLVAMAGVGYSASAFLVGFYLLVSFNVMGRHANEAFSALRIENYKNFLRLHINKAGNLTVYPVGIDNVSDPTFRLIENPILINPNTAHHGELLDETERPV